MANTNESIESEDSNKQKKYIRNPVYWLAVGLGSGLVPKAPGTAGTLAAVPVYLLMNGLLLWQYIAIVLLAMAAGIWICGVAAKQLDVHDDPSIVWDEVVGFLITMAAAPPGWLWLVIGFILFRLFDITKPWPIRTIDRCVEGGLGIMLDDVLAGIYALIVLQLMINVTF